VKEETVGGDEADRWVPPVIRGREEEGTLSGFWPGGPWAASEAGPNGFLWGLFPFFDFFFFSFSGFPISLITFAIIFQFKSNFFQKFSKRTAQYSKSVIKQVFK
jgi:hypothetical protein